MTVMTERQGWRRGIHSAPIEDAHECDLEDLKALLTASLPDSSPHTVWDLPWTWSAYRVLRAPGTGVVAAAALTEVDAGTREIRGLVVHRAARGLGLATRLLEDLLSRADGHGFDIVCMTRIPAFFERFGFFPTVPLWLSEHRWLPAPRPEQTPRIAMRRPVLVPGAAA